MCLKIMDVLQSANITKVQGETKSRILIYSILVGIFKALWHGFFEILQVLCDNLLRVIQSQSDQ